MFISDLIALAKAGYTPAQVKELLSMDAENKAKVEEAPQAVPKEETQREAPKTETDASTPKLPEDIKSDLEKQIEDLKKELEENKEKLQQAQQQNTTADISGNTKTKSVEEVLNGIARDFM